MPLSDHEQRQLEQIEQALYADHPRLAKAMRARDPKVHYRRRVIQAAAGFVIGAGVLAAGLKLGHTWLWAAGVAVMALSGAWAMLSYRRMAAMVLARRRERQERRRGRVRAPATGGPAATSGLMERLEERWRRRQEGDGPR